MPLLGSTEALVALDQAAQPQANGLQMLVLFLGLGVVWYFLLIRPQVQEQKEHEAALAALKKDDAVVTKGGLHGKVVSVEGDVLIIEIAEKTRVRVERSAISGRVGANASEKA